MTNLEALKIGLKGLSKSMEILREYRDKACGNSMGVNCMRWIGLGIEAVEKAKATDKGEKHVD